MSVARHALPARLDLSTAGELAAALRGHEGSDLTLEAGELTHLGTPGVQVLLAAKRSWQEAGRTLSFADVDPGLEEQLGQLGLALADLTTGNGGDVPPPSELAPREADAAPPVNAAAPADAAPPGSEAEGTAPDSDVGAGGASPPPEAESPSRLAALEEAGAIADASATADEADGALEGGPDQDNSDEEY
jgi:chemotaxis protein CheX